MILKLLALLLFLGLLAIAGLAWLSWSSREPTLGLENGRLKPCPGTPNCVCSEPGTPGSQRVDPLPFHGDADTAWKRVKGAIEAMGGRIVEERPGYLHAIFTSRFFRFVDDIELRLEEDEGVVQVRSASRVGHSDFGVNRKRVERLRAGFRSP